MRHEHRGATFHPAGCRTVAETLELVRSSLPAKITLHATIPDQPPSSDLPLGSDDQGRDMLAVLVAGVPLTLRVGFIAGTVGLVIGIILGFLSAALPMPGADYIVLPWGEVD